MLTSYPQNHQNQTVVEGLSNSCNYFFYEVSFRTGMQTLNEWAAALGLTSRTNIELPASPPASSATRTPSTTRTWPSRTR